ncbi:MAG: fucose isomerase, partial [Thermoguttaceae bacterium]
MAKLPKKQVYLAASGDLRLTANRDCWATQKDMEAALTKAVSSLGYTVVRAHPYKESEKHGFISSQKEGLEIFSKLDPNAPIIIAESVWQYSNHVLPGLLGHKGPILTIANWSGTWPGLVGMLNLNGCLIKAGREFSTLWSVDFTDKWFLDNLQKWFETGKIKHKTNHVTSLAKLSIPATDKKLGTKLADEFRQTRPIMGIFDEGCMGMYNAIIQDELLFPLGVFKERLSQSALYYATTQVSDKEARDVYKWLLDRGLKFHFGQNAQTELTEGQVLLQCKMYIAAARIADQFGCDAIGIQYQQGLKDLLPASDLVEGILNNTDRPPVKSEDGKRVLFPNEPIVHFNEVDEGSALDAMITNRVCKALNQPVETTLHDVRWGDWDQSGTTKEFVWVFQISGAVPPAHIEGGWRGSESMRQSTTYFRLGGGTLRGLGKPGEIVWSRIFVENGKLGMDIGRGRVIHLPKEETDRRSNLCTKEWPLVSTVLDGVTRDQFMARHRANHIQLVYANDAKSADKLLATKAAMCEQLGIAVNVCGTVPKCMS